MAEFERRPETGNIFEGTSDEVTEVTLRIKYDLISRYNRNSENKLQSEQVMQLTSSDTGVSFFQKQKADGNI